MERNFMTQARHYLSSQQKQKIGQKILFCLAAVVVFATVYALILPAITLSNELLCGQEAHKHTETCWAMAEAKPQPELICEFMRVPGPVVHTHNDYCRDDDGKLICRLPEVEAHAHTDDCYQERRTLVCEESQELGHEHTSGCYTHVRGELTCTDEGGHSHTDACYTETENRTLTCTLPEEPGHTHDDNCYEERSHQTLTCSQEESEDVLDEEGNLVQEGHAHTEDCYQEETESVLVCEESADGGHTHTDDCYTVETERELTCSLQESESHAHTDNCYDWSEELICHEEERASGHTHSEECYEVEEILVCREEEVIPHTHTMEECFTLKESSDGQEEDEYILTCVQPEVLSHVHDSSCVYLPETVVEEDVPTLTCGIEEHEHTEACYMEVYPEDTVSYYCGLAEHEHTEDCYFESSGLLRCTLAVHHHDELCQIPELWETTPEDVEEVEGVQLDNDFETATEDGYYRVTFHITGYAPVISGGEMTDPELPPDETDGFLPPPDDADLDDGADTDAMPPEDQPEVDSGLAPSPGTPEPTPEPIQRPSKPAETRPAETPEAPLQPQDPDPVPEEEPSVPEPDPAPPPAPEPEQQAPAIVVPMEPFVPETGPLTPDEEILNSGLAPAQMSLQRRLRLLLPEDEVFTEAEGLADVRITLVEQEPEPLPEPEPPASEDEEETAEAEVIPERELSFVATLNGQELDLSQCEITVTVSLSEELAAALNSRESVVQTLDEMDVTDENAVPEDADAESETPEVETILTVRTMDGAGEVVNEDMAEISSETTASEVTLSMRSTDRLRTRVDEKWDTVFPTYNVEYYAYLDRPVEAKSVTVNGNIAKSNENGADVLPFIDTTGGILPQNTKTQPTKYFELKPSGGGFEIAFDSSKPTQIYRTIENRRYSSSAGLKTSDLDAAKRKDNAGLQDNHYNLVELWVLEPGVEDKDFDSPNWTKYTSDERKKDVPGYVYVSNLEDLKYSNYSADTAEPPAEMPAPSGETGEPAETPNEVCITIRKGMTLRLVYNPDTGKHTNPTNFYDYDISDGFIYGSNDASPGNRIARDGAQKPYFMNTQKYGINDDDNYLKNGDPKFAFGNMNAGTNYGEVEWNGNKPNRGNHAVTGAPPGTGRGCTFGLVPQTGGITSTGGLKFISGIDGPDLFGSGAAKGKTFYPGGLDFSRKGDTYTLTNVSGQGLSASNLHILGHTGGYQHIFSNNFWPLDAAPSFGADGHDAKFGTEKYGDPKQVKAIDSDSGYGMPTSDDWVDHNAYFGMKFSVDFQIPAEYVGPLEYFFYGDDDMWVYLMDSRGTESSRLVCDLGGVHSSVGQYVNLWDYINQDEVKNSKNGKSYRLVFFYTERGASGSTCWMQYTLPNISIVPTDPPPPSWEKEALRIEKQVEGDVSHLDAEQKYEFSITLNGTDQYLGHVYDKDGNQVGEPITISPKTETPFFLRAGDYLKVLELKENTGYVVKEISKLANCHVSVTVTDAKGQTHASEDKNTADGIEGGVVVFTNAFYFELPETGGPGIPWHTLGGGLLMAAGCLWYRKKPNGEGAVDCK